MHPDDKERLIQIVIQEVMAAIMKGAADSSARSVAEANPIIHVSDRLLTAAKLQTLAGNSCKHLIIGPACIVTPSALDLLRKLGVTLERKTKPLTDSIDAGPTQKNVALVSRFLLKMHRQAISNALHEPGWNGIEMNVPAGARDLEPQLELISSGIKKKELQAAIIFDDHVNLLYTRLQRSEGLMPVIGWSKESIAGARVSPQANVLLLNYRSCGAHTLQELITVWLSTGRSEG